jgi:signal peptidase I
VSVRSLTRAVNVLTVLLVIVGTWFFVLPTSLGGFSIYTVVSGPSMQPTYHTGDLVLARPARQYRVGQVVTYAIPDKKYKGYRVVHRVVERTADGHYVTQGDNQAHADPWTIGHDDIEGGRVLSIPKAGYLLAYMRNPIYLGLLFGIAVTFVAWPRRSSDDDEAIGEAENDRASSVPEHVDTPTFDWALAVPPLFDASPENVERRRVTQPVRTDPVRERVGAAHAELDEYVRDWASMFEGSTEFESPTVAEPSNG